MIRSKGTAILIEAMSILKAAYPNLRLRIIGQEENIKTRELHYMADRLRVDTMISFDGFQSNVSKVMNDCSIGVVSSTGE